MPPRKPIPSHQKPRFTPQNITRAIEGVEAAGLEVYGVEITPRRNQNQHWDSIQSRTDQRRSTGQ